MEINLLQRFHPTFVHPAPNYNVIILITASHSYLKVVYNKKRELPKHSSNSHDQ